MIDAGPTPATGEHPGAQTPAPVGAHASVSLRFATRGVDLAFTVAPGETVAIVGPNGAGKSTILDALAGVIRPDSGRATVNGTVLFDLPVPSEKTVPSEKSVLSEKSVRSELPGRSRWLAPHRRSVSLLAQDALLFPHLSVLENVAFGPRSAGVPAREARETARHWLREVEAEHLADRRPAELSGGQAQRIAVARALAPGPDLLLLDEPLAALDVAVAPAVRRMLRRVLANRTAVIITHDVLDAYTLADRVVIVEGGRIVDAGTPAEVFERPRTAFAAELAGVNRLTGIRSGDLFVPAASPGGTTVGTGAWFTSGGGRENEDGAPFRSGAGSTQETDSSFRSDTGPERDGNISILLEDWPDLPDGVPISLAVRPADVTVSVEKPQVTTGLVRARLIDLEPRGDVVRVRSALFAADVSPREAAMLDAAVGSPLWFSFRAGSTTVYPTSR